MTTPRPQPIQITTNVTILVTRLESPEALEQITRHIMDALDQAIEEARRMATDIKR